MVQIRGTKGNIVHIEILGIGEVIRMLRAKNHQIELGADLGVIRAGTFIQEEVKESIMGKRAEHKSIDTGRFVNSIEFKRIKSAQGIVHPKSKNYPNTNINTKDIAAILEFGTSRLNPRRHFGNTAKRNAKKVDEIIEKEVVRMI